MRFLKINLFLFIFAFSPYFVIADTLSNPHYYSIISPSGKESFLFGTIHGGVEISDVPSTIIQKLNESKTLMNEWTFIDSEVEAILKGQVVEVQLKKFKHKGADLSIAEKAQLVNAWGVDPRLADKAKSNDCSLLSFGGPISTGFIDFHFINMAQKQKKKIIALDTQEQFDKLREKNPSEPCDIRKVMRQLSPDQFRLSQLDLIKEYRTGQSPNTQEYDPVTDGRNLFWMPKILNEVKDGNIFIAVGYFHLYGSKGLIKLFEDKGYRVLRMP